MSELSFQQLVSKIASRMRHDLKGGLVTLKMGLESLDDEEALKPLLLAKAQEMVDLSDKLILLLRMGETKKCSVALTGLVQHITREITTKFPKIKLVCESPETDVRLFLDPDAFAYAVLELAQNALLAGATQLRAEVSSLADGSPADGQISFVFTDDAPVESTATGLELSKCLEFGCSGWERSGLGLSIVEGFAAAHSGHMEVTRDGHWRLLLKWPVGEAE